VTAIVLSFVIALALNGAFFAVAAARRTDVVTDLSYSLTFALLAIVLPFTGARGPSQLIASLLVLLWAIRLGGYLFRRILRMKVDHRFDGMRDKPLRFARFWLLQRDPARSLVSAQPLGKLEAVDTGHLHVGEDEIRAFTARLLERIKSVFGLAHVQPLGGQVDRADQPHRGVVIHDQDTSGLAVATSRGIERTIAAESLLDCRSLRWACRRQTPVGPPRNETARVAPGTAGRRARPR
jgi:hypothetical protein